jgi:FHA domain/Transglycosylase SLT domain
MEVTLSIYTPHETRSVALEGTQFTIGSDASAHLVIADAGLSAIHATVYRDGDRFWILDEQSAGGTFVNSYPVPPVGTPLRDGDEILLGGDVSIVLRMHATVAPPVAALHEPRDASAPGTPLTAPTGGSSLGTMGLIVGLFAAVLVLIVVVVLAASAFNHGDTANKQTNNQRRDPVDDPTPSPVLSPIASVNPTIDPSPEATSSVELPGSRKLYTQMTKEEQLEFIEQHARQISLMMGNRPYAFNDDVLGYIKQYVDGYARRVGNNSGKLWGEDLRFMFARAREQYAPYIIRSFNQRGVPPVVGLYLVVVETEYHNIQSENAAGAAGLFQFIGPTARGYGVDPSERTNVAKMAPAAAAYMSDRIAEFGPDSMSVALAIAGYNRSPDSVRRDLHDVLNSGNPERSFWTLVANSSKLDHYFQGENIKYVPKFFAAAIVGENPWAFGIQMQPLSTYTEIKNPPPNSADTDR